MRVLGCDHSGLRASILCTLTERRYILGPMHSLSRAEASESERTQPAPRG